MNVENKLKLSIANKLFKEQQRKPMTLGQPKLPPMKEQEAHFVTHLPYVPWCQACVASRAKEDNREVERSRSAWEECDPIRSLHVPIGGCRFTGYNPGIVGNSALRFCLLLRWRAVHKPTSELFPGAVQGDSLSCCPEAGGQ